MSSYDSMLGLTEVTELREGLAEEEDDTMSGIPQGYDNGIFDSMYLKSQCYDNVMIDSMI